MMKVTGKGPWGVKTTPITEDWKKVYSKPKGNGLYGKAKVSKVYGKPRKMPGL